MTAKIDELIGTLTTLASAVSGRFLNGKEPQS